MLDGTLDDLVFPLLENGRRNSVPQGRNAMQVKAGGMTLLSGGIAGANHSAAYGRVDGWVCPKR